jgi:hypothetical protein
MAQFVAAPQVADDQTFPATGYHSDHRPAVAVDDPALARLRGPADLLTGNQVAQDESFAAAPG